MISDYQYIKFLLWLTLKMKDSLELKQLVVANRILANEGVVDAFGHVSIRHPKVSNHYIMSRSRAPELVELDDLMEFNIDGSVINKDARIPYGERFIHGALMEARKEINAVVHNHSYEVLPFSITENQLKPVIHTASVIGLSIPVWDIRDNFGPNTDMLVRNMDQGRDLAKKMDKNTCILMRGHGAVIAGRTLKEAVVASIYLKVNAQIQTLAMNMGNPVPLSEGEITHSAKVHNSSLGMDRMWEAFCLRAGVKPT